MNFKKSIVGLIILATFSTGREVPFSYGEENDATAALLAALKGANAWNVGDYGFVFTELSEGGWTLFGSTSDLYYYAKVSIEEVNRQNNRAKVYVDSICWRALNNKAYCRNSSENGGGFVPGQYKWVNVSSLNRSIPDRKQ